MNNIFDNKAEFQKRGFTTINSVYSQEEIDSIIKFIEEQDTNSPIFRKSENLFAIRQFIKELPEIKPLIFNDRLKSIINIIGENAFIVKSIYFDKPEESNWFVAYHQDLTISVNKKEDVEGFGPWTSKHNQFAVQPPIEILENIFTIRIHLDDTNENNGALKVIDGSHHKNIYRPENIDWKNEKQSCCNVDAGGIMLMKPLLLHSSSRTLNHKRRRVIHIEFSNIGLPKPLKWSEYSQISY
ncbi:phytanoyl-CoA dioxygenase family protein [Flavobacterium lindanitolerans]|uniref:phytanoyl-CoA dioxygenase family protein n=1 Tax=Flavobacterium lindanitolerans TaxID=428988 RepID=UPI002806C9F6|nr:phytanoyl-CoA dioxygenase family protein [Flavobacterium lindanitolerans]MDQ7962101.1 phytanoyl-CoA dioxygenase family protein [Flavobacterium lindanitolerans]